MTVHLKALAMVWGGAVMAEVLPIETPGLGDRSYLVHDGSTALVVDPQRDTDRITGLAGAHGVRITHIAETHIHNDYLTGGPALAAATGAAYLVNAADPVGFHRTPVIDGDTVEVSDALRIRVLATPGHTFTHLSYVLQSGGRVAGVFTGGSLLYGTTGRPDLLGPEHTGTLARAQYASAHRLAAELPGTTPVFPTHGFGSFCSAGQAGGQSSTIGGELLANPVLVLGERDYLAGLLAGLDTWPAYYAHMGPANLAGPAGPDLSPPRQAGPEEVRRRLDAGEWVIDLRDRIAFAAEFLPGSVSFPLESSFASYVGWAVPWGAPLTLLGETPEQVAQAQRELARIWAERPVAAASGGPPRWAAGTALASLRLAKFGDLAAALSGPGPAPAVLDVRRPKEWAEGHIAGAVHIPFDELPRRAGEVPPGEVWVHCQGGYRAMVAASLLAGRGCQVVGVDDDFGNAAAAGLPLQPG
jgi:glyoxylase-like metal-dependent hydrolase (beta-lactamase superfamily II)/rhodanese-related sulfurtransferase